ncbi:uncharacterized protein LOC131670276 isoform X1 [Phymastichus coffea]|uniref:uncharacterized protein LOC131670276 isoform X1 n=1 Tax=Phymastichus coffea TaxID=108790 RepID=UPI00273C5922|nr:uncharacterized protein LOC131670276 isoform X1 [Phymastichus coffea]
MFVDNMKFEAETVFPKTEAKCMQTGERTRVRKVAAVRETTRGSVWLRARPSGARGKPAKKTRVRMLAGAGAGGELRGVGAGQPGHRGVRAALPRDAHADEPVPGEPGGGGSAVRAGRAGGRLHAAQPAVAPGRGRLPAAALLAVRLRLRAALDAQLHLHGPPPVPGRGAVPQRAHRRPRAGRLGARLGHRGLALPAGRLLVPAEGLCARARARHGRPSTARLQRRVCSQTVADGRTICTLVFPRSEALNVSLCFTLPVVALACLLPMGLLVYHYQRIFQRMLDTRHRWAVPCVAQGLESESSRRRDSELSVVGVVVPWAGRKLSSASMTGGAGCGAGRQVRAGSLSQHEEVRLHKHLRVVRVLLLNVGAVLLMWLPITVVMLLIYLDGRRPTEDTDFFLRSHHFVWALVVAQFNTVVNPLLYGVFSENFRACFAKLWRREAAHNNKSNNKSNNNNNNNNSNNNNPASGERPSGAAGSRAGGARSLEVLQTRLAGRLTGNGCSSNKSPSCGIASIIEMPASEKL